MPISNRRFYIDLSHPITATDSDDTVIRRYFKREYFDQFLKERALYFRKARLFADSLEGTINDPTRKYIKHLGNTSSDPAVVGINNEKLLSSFNSVWREATYINCWNLAKDEQEYMWSTFASDPQDVCLKTTLSMLKTVFPLRPHKVDSATEMILYMARVKYINHQSDFVPYLNMFVPFTIKDLKYKNESEVRLILDLVSAGIEPNAHDGLKVSVPELFQFGGVDARGVTRRNP